MQIYLPITAFQVQSGEPFGMSHRVQHIVSPGQWETVFPCDIIQLPVVYAEAQAPLLPDQNDGEDQGQPDSDKPTSLHDLEHLAHIRLLS
jgi:hypothetical protein